MNTAAAFKVIAMLAAAGYFGLAAHTATGSVALTIIFAAVAACVADGIILIFGGIWKLLSTIFEDVKTNTNSEDKP